jgi:hypothetical protein
VNALLGLVQRWRTPIGDRVVTFAPRPCGAELVSRSGASMYGFERSSGDIRWQTTVPDATGLTACFTVVDRVAITEVRDSMTKRSHVYGYGAGGTLQWRTILDGPVGHVVAGARALGAIVQTTPRGFVTIDATDGALSTTWTLPFPAASLASLGPGRWAFGYSAPGAGSPALYVLDGDAATPVPTDHAVWKIGAAAGALVVAERDGASKVGALVARDASTLAVTWRQPIVGEAFALGDDVVVAMTGTPSACVPTGFDLVTGEPRWRGTELPKPAAVISAAAAFVLVTLVSTGGPVSVLYTAQGRCVGTHAGYTSKDLVVDGDDVLLTVDGDAVCLALPGPA